ncbi:MAG: hypothetical protein KKC84_04115 [Candidatus Omnitrophica bacterium]|nr:hypothetical protein [Candidatus Omnitrophota bacterium]
MLSQTGCLLPFLIVFNFLFGWIFLRPLVWIVLEGVLLLLFLYNSLAITRRVVQSSSPRNTRAEVIDVEAQTVEENPRVS